MSALSEQIAEMVASDKRLEQLILKLLDETEAALAAKEVATREKVADQVHLEGHRLWAAGLTAAGDHYMEAARFIRGDQ